jgi:DNA end-binding protein Ku
MVRGYETDSGDHVAVTDAELEALAPEKSRDIDLSRFVPVVEIDPMLFERGYFLAPGGASGKAYRLLAEVLERTERAGIATFVMRDKEYLVAILAEAGVLRAETLRFADEVRSAADVGLPRKRKVAAAKVKTLERAIAARAKESLDPDELTDPWSEELVELAEKKLRQHKDVVEVPEDAEEEELAEVIDLMEVLKRSLGGGATGRRRAGGHGTSPSHGTRSRSRGSTRGPRSAKRKTGARAG